MYTINYKGFYIHGYCGIPQCTVKGVQYVSLHAAKCAIARVLIPSHDSDMALVFGR